MFRLTNLADYAVVIMGALAVADSRTSARDLAAEAGLPVPTVAKILNALARDGLILSHRGLKGGFALARPAAEISVAAIIEAMEGPIALTHCIDTEAGRCELDDICRMRGPWQHINHAVRQTLEAISLADLIASEPVIAAADRTANSTTADIGAGTTRI